MSLVPSVDPSTIDTVPSVDPSTIGTLHHDILSLIVSLLSDIDMQIIKSKIIYDKICMPLTDHGYLDLLKLYIDQDTSCYDIYSYICTHAARNGHINILQWLRNKGIRLSNAIYTDADDNVEVLQWALDNGYKLNNDDLGEHAAINGYLNALKWAQLNGCKMTSYMCKNAIMGQQLVIVQWLLANGCQWDMWLYELARSYGNQNMIQWLQVNGYMVTLCNIVI